MKATYIDGISNKERIIDLTSFSSANKAQIEPRFSGFTFTSHGEDADAVLPELSASLNGIYFYFENSIEGSRITLRCNDSDHFVDPNLIAYTDFDVTTRVLVPQKLLVLPTGRFRVTYSAVGWKVTKESTAITDTSLTGSGSFTFHGWAQKRNEDPVNDDPIVFKWRDIDAILLSYYHSGIFNILVSGSDGVSGDMAAWKGEYTVWQNILVGSFTKVRDESDDSPELGEPELVIDSGQLVLRIVNRVNVIGSEFDYVANLRGCVSVRTP